MRLFNMPPPSSPPRSYGKVVLFSLSSLLLSVAQGAEPVLLEKFEGATMRSIGLPPDYWAVQHLPEGHLNTAQQGRGRLQIFAEDRAYAHVSLSSPKTRQFGFFFKPLTITLDDIQLRAEGIPEGEARFKLSLAASRTTAELAPSVICLRVRSGLLLMGYRVDGFNLASPPETLAGDRVNSVAVMPLKGVPTQVSLTLGPSTRDGLVRYEITARDDGELVTRSGNLALSLSQWGDADESSIIIDVRRDSATAQPGTHAEFSTGQIMVTR